MAELSGFGSNRRKTSAVPFFFFFFFFGTSVLFNTNIYIFGELFHTNALFVVKRKRGKKENEGKKGKENKEKMIRFRCDELK